MERDVELAAIAELIGFQRGRVLAVEGPPGIGKSALIAAAKSAAESAGLQVLGARGSELERSFSYGVVRQLFEPLLAGLEARDRHDAFRGAAAPAAQLFELGPAATGADADTSLATLHGLYWLAANLASRSPLLLVIDDLHWSDLPSLRWLAYLLPRMEGLDLIVVVGLRAEEPGVDPGVLARVISDPLAATIRPAPLSDGAVAGLVRETLGPEAETAFCAACREETGGNPLLLRELVHVLADEGLAPTAANVPRLRDLEARAGARAFASRLSRLSTEALALARAVAILGDDADIDHAEALAGLDEGAASDALGELARVDVLRPQAPLGFVHQLIGAAVYQSLPPRERDSGHARAAALLGDAGAEPERVATHLLRTAPAGSEAVVETLRDAARRAASRGAAESAVAYLRRALAEPPRPDGRARLLVELGGAEGHVDGDAAVEHLREAHRLSEGTAARAETALLLGRQLFLLHGDQADAVFTAALAELGDSEPELGRMLEVGLITNGLFEPALHEEALRRLGPVRDRLAGAASDDTVGEKLLLSLLAYHDARAGVPGAEAVALARRALAGGVLVRTGQAGALIPPCTVLAMADLEEVLAIYEEMLTDAHRRGSIFSLAAVQAFRAQVHVWRGELDDAEVDAAAALAAAEAWGASARFAAHAAAFLADSLMEQGRLDEAAVALVRGEQGAALPDSARLLFLRDSSARLRILRGDLAGGSADLIDAGRRFESVGSRNPAFIAWRSTAALALLALGERDEALALASEELELARAWGAPRALAGALRAAGLTEGGERGLGLLGEAVEVAADSPARLEHAKARTELGAALRRAGNRAAAREQLRPAVELATRCGAVALAGRAETELLATGARPRRVALSGVDSLTPSERRVAEMAAEGPTNREIAQLLFVTQRTVEVHLTSIYRKLEISSRTQLADALAGD